MKKVVLTLVAALLSVTMMAQVCQINNNGFGVQNAATKGATKDVLPEWHAISQNVSGVDINNNTISTAAIMASGKAMVIDYSAVWCSWCWVMHQNGILEAIKDQLGSQVEVLWVEADPSTTPGQGLTGGTGSQGNWTVTYNTTNPVPYPIVDDASFTDLIGGSSVIEGYPTVVFVSPTGYWCDVYGTDWGFGPYSASDAVSAISNLLTSYPQAGVIPQISISGKSGAFVNQAVQFSANIISVDNVTDISWSFPGANTTTATGANPPAVTWTTAGTYTVTLSVTNTTGTATATHTITIRDGWTWGDEMDYTDGGDYETSIGYGGNGDIHWGVMYPANLVAGRNYLTKASLFVNDGSTGNYELMIYQGGETAPQTLVYDGNYNVTESGQWVDFPILGGLTLDQTKSLWVTFHCNGVNYPATLTTYVEDPNTDLLNYNGEWVHLGAISSFVNTWMIKATTSATRPAFDFEINGNSSFMSGETVEFSITGPSDATYNWTLQGATPATATGTTASASWATPGNYTITVQGTLTGSVVTKTLNVTVIDGSINLPFYDDFESGLNYWSTVDVDGDGYTWTFNGFDGHNGSTNAIASASYINNIGVLTPDNWLISNTFTVPGGGATIEWWEYGVDNNDYADNYSVYVSENGGNEPADFMNGLLFNGAPTSPKTWVKHSRNISSGLAGRTVRVAFRHHDITNMYWLLIDDVRITAGNTAGIEETGVAKVDFYPNPVTDKLYISEEVHEVSVLDVNGRTIMSETNTRVIDMSNLANGVYIVRVVTNDGIATKKIVKK